MKGVAFTRALREVAAWAWVSGLALIAFDFLSLPVFRWRASISYLFFGLAAVATVWAEKREFSTRIFLYRLHDTVIYGPWRFLLLYFLWVSLFASFTSSRLAFLVYAGNGWLSLFLIGLSAQFIFCERTERGAVLLPDRLRRAFLVYGATVSLLMATTLVGLLFSGLPPWIPLQQRMGLFFYFFLGLPFLLWDFVKDGRRLLPRYLSLATIWLGSLTVLLLGRKVYQLTLFLAIGGVVALFLYKRIRPRRTLLLSGMATGLALLVAGAMSLGLPPEGPLTRALNAARQAMEWRLKSVAFPTWEALSSSRFLGTGLGGTDILGVWGRVLAEAGIVGLFLYSMFFVALAIDLYRVRRSPRVIVSNVAMLSVVIFLMLLSHYVENPYGAYVWVWYSIWGIFASTSAKRRSVI